MLRVAVASYLDLGFTVVLLLSSYSQLQAKELYIVKCIPLANMRYS